MPRTAYVNGHYVAYDEAMLSIDDRAVQFGDSVYEVVAVRRGHLVELDDHLSRLERSLRELRMAQPRSRTALKLIMKEIQRRNHVHNGLLYVQVTRGVAPRNHKFPSAAVRPGIVVTGKSRIDQESVLAWQKGVKVLTVPDDRWRRRDVKSTNLLANVMAKQAAADAGCREAWLVDDDGFVTEGTSSTAWIVSRTSCIITRPLSNDILHGVTRGNLLRVIEAHGYSVEERAFTVTEAEHADEAFITSANNPVTPVVQINDTIVGNGEPGPVTRRLQEHYAAVAGAL